MWKTTLTGLAVAFAFAGVEAALILTLRVRHWSLLGMGWEC